MERRLLLAKELLNPDDSVLIVTIDEKEYLRLGLLLEQIFPEAGIRWSRSRNQPAGVIRVQRNSTRTDEYPLLRVDSDQLTQARTDDDMLDESRARRR